MSSLYFSVRGCASLCGDAIKFTNSALAQYCIVPSLMPVKASSRIHSWMRCGLCPTSSAAVCVGRASGSSAHCESSHRRKASQFSGVASNIGSGCHSVRLENIPLSYDKNPGSVSIRALNRTASSVRTRYLWVVCPVFSCGI